MKPRIAVLATGGTIAGSGQAGKDTGYKPGVISAESLISSVPALAEVADIQTIQVCNLNSDDMTDSIWIDLAQRINDLSRELDTDGFVVTHGTDTLEETAYFLNLTVKTDKCVVVTGAMRPATAASPDGPANLLLAVEAAASGANRGKGVQVSFAGRLFPAREAVKRHTAALDAVTMDKDALEPGRLHTTSTEFDISGLKALPKVTVLYFNVDADPALVAYAASNSDGVVIAGAGAGEFSLLWKSAIEKCKVPVVVSSRTGCGPVLQETMVCPNAVAAGTLQPAKAAVLLRLALTRTRDTKELIRIFGIY
ncbi:MAG: asparaginase [Spirochaetia bacterium]|nr:asparaginase [Spirochaetia bacterium]